LFELPLLKPVLIPKNNPMKTLKNLSLSALLILFSSFSYIHEPTVITLVSTKNIKDASELIVDFDGEIITDTWNKDNLVRIEMEIKVDDISRAVVKHLVSKRRFAIKTELLDDGSVLLFMPNLKLPVYINGHLLSEDISYRLLVPKNVVVRIKSWEEYRGYKYGQNPSNIRR
jgi:hypothetical protein